jgi:hypothetical protein
VDLPLMIRAAGSPQRDRRTEGQPDGSRSVQLGIRKRVAPLQPPPGCSTAEIREPRPS